MPGVSFQWLVDNLQLLVPLTYCLSPSHPHWVTCLRLKGHALSSSILFPFSWKPAAKGKETFFSVFKYRGSQGGSRGGNPSSDQCWLEPSGWVFPKGSVLNCAQTKPRWSAKAMSIKVAFWSPYTSLIFLMTSELGWGSGVLLTGPLWHSKTESGVMWFFF